MVQNQQRILMILKTLKVQNTQNCSNKFELGVLTYFAFRMQDVRFFLKKTTSLSMH